MARKNSAVNNIVRGSNLFNWNGGAETKANQLFDPFNFGGWNDGPAWEIDYSNMPVAPEYLQGYNPLDMSLSDQADSLLANVNLDKRGLDRFREEALRTGPSSWANKMEGKLRAEEAQARELGGRDVRGQQAEARTQLAMRGGTTSGARERLAQAGLRNYLDMSQNVARQGAINRMGVGVADEENRIKQLGLLPGLEVQALQPELDKSRMKLGARETDTKNLVMEKQAQNAWRQNAYNQQMQAWAAGQQAQATANADSGKK